MSSFFFNSFFILVQYIILKLNVSSHPPVYENSGAAPPTNFSYEPPLVRTDMQTAVLLPCQSELTVSFLYSSPEVIDEIGSTHIVQECTS
jgi:hypothetical protein